jgi:hypothetical protein
MSARKNAAWILAGLALAAAGAMAGLRLRDKPIGEGRVQRSARYYDHDAKEIWAKVVDPGRWKEWRTDLDVVAAVPDIRGHKAWRIDDRGEANTWEIVETFPDRRVTMCVASTDGPYGGCQVFEMVKRDDGAIITFIEALRPRSQTFALVHTARSRTHRLDAALDQLGAALGQPDPPKRDKVRELSIYKREVPAAGKDSG